VGRERGYPLGACGSPCDADYEDGSVPLQLPLSCADHCIEARREGCHLREIDGDPTTGNVRPRAFAHHLGAPNCRSGRASPSSPAPSAHRYAAAGLDRSVRPNKQAFVPYLGICAEWQGWLVSGKSGDRAVTSPYHLTECRNERRQGRAVMASNASCRRSGTNALSWRHR